MSGKTEKTNGDLTRLPIRPMRIPSGLVRTKRVKISEIKLDVIPEEKIVFRKAITAYFDVLGFSQKKTSKDVEMTLLDFAGPFVMPSIVFRKIRFNIFSDCAFVAASTEDAAELLAATRYAFTQWSADGILVRGGIALGTYREIHGAALKTAPRNFTGNFFGGTAVTKAVRQEASGVGALLFASGECAEFYKREYGEPIFYLPGAKIIEWSDDESVLYWYVGVSLIRLLKVLSTKDGIKHCATPHLLNNIKYSIAARKSPRLRLLVLSILSLPGLNPRAREEAIGLLEIRDPDDFERLKEFINQWLRNKKAFRIIEIFANFDTSIPGSLYAG